MSKINWDAANRQARLEKWIRENGQYGWLDELQPLNREDSDAWAKREVRKSISKVRKTFTLSNQEKELKNIDELLHLLAEKLELGLELEALPLGQKIFNHVNSLPLTTISNSTREQLVQTLSLLFVAIE